jgi:hypothetical protein
MRKATGASRREMAGDDWGEAMASRLFHRPVMRCSDRGRSFRAAATRQGVYPPE